MNNLYFNNIKSNLQALRALGLDTSEGEYICPICMKPFSLEEGDVGMLTDEHVPQHSLGGQKLTLTCNDCNNTLGYDTDIHLLGLIDSVEQNEFLHGSNRKVTVLKEGKRLNATLEVNNRYDLKLRIDPGRNNPETWEEFKHEYLLESSLIDIKNVPSKKEDRNVSSAIIKNAYLILFAKTGFTFLKDRFYNLMRKQILNPHPYYLPERLWTLQSINAKDGIYLTKDNHYRGFFIVYSLKRIRTHKVCCLIPVPTVDYLVCAKELQKIEAHSSIKLQSLPDEMNFYTNKAHIQRLLDWAYGWNIQF